MFLTKRSSTGYYYLFYVDESGHRHAVSTRSKLKSEALKFLQAFRQEDCEQAPRHGDVPLSAFTMEFLAHSASIHTPKNVLANRVALTEFRRVCGDLTLNRVGVREIERFLVVKIEEASIWTARKYHLALGAAFETARRWGYINANPFRSVPHPKPPEVTPVFFTVEEFRRLLGVIPDRDYSDLVQAAVMTGMRLGELLSLEWSAVDLGRGVITVSNTRTFTTKSKKGRVIPMHNALRPLLLARHQTQSEVSRLVFTLRGRGISESNASHRFKKAVRAAGLDDRLHFHSLRHAFASWLVQAGVSLYEVQKLLGHSSPTVTEVYSHLQPEHLRGTVNKITVSLN